MLDIYTFNASIDSLSCRKLEINNKRLTRQVKHETKISPYISRKSTHWVKRYRVTKVNGYTKMNVVT